MSGTNNPYDPTEMYRRWLQQNEQFQSEFQKGFERMRQQIDEISRLPESWKRITEQMENMNRQGGFANQMVSEGAQQFNDMVKAAMAPWQQQSAGQMAVPNMLLGWAAFKTSIGSNGRISIPEAERNALSLDEGDLVQVVVLPVSKKEVNK